MECPFIDKTIKPSKFNVPIKYRDPGSNTDYIFYKHDDGFGTISLVQFCTRLGRKKDVFECLIEDEWKQCRAYSPPKLRRGLRQSLDGQNTTNAIHSEIKGVEKQNDYT